MTIDELRREVLRLGGENALAAVAQCVRDRGDLAAVLRGCSEREIRAVLMVANCVITADLPVGVLRSAAKTTLRAAGVTVEEAQGWLRGAEIVEG